jgi:Predicted membrane protein (DUF2339)
MEFLGLLAIGFLVGIPVVAIAALVRTGTLRRLLDESSWETRDKISELREEISDLRRELARVSQRVNGQTIASPSVPTVETAAPEPSPVPAEATWPETHLAPSISLPEAALRASLDSQAAHASSPQVFLRQSIPGPAPSWPDAVPAQPTSSAIVPPAPKSDPVFSSKAGTRADAISAQPHHYSPPPKSPGTEQPIHARARTDDLHFTSFEDAPPRKSFAEWIRSTLPLEEVLGMNLFAKIGIVLLVLGFALLGRVALISMGPGARVAMIYAAAAALLGGGIWLERKERYRLVGRTGIGGGWALLFFTTYAMHHVDAMLVMNSNTLNCALLLGVAMAMVAHTLRYQSQLVTGLAFLLAFSTVAISQDSVYSLVAGVILAAGIVTISLRMKWYELEVFGILASYANHFYWLYQLFPDGVAGHQFPQFWPSAIILIFYWAIFRISYVVRVIRAPRDEAVSTIAALLNTMLLLAVMKFQSTRPELAFYALLGLGAMEFFCGQLPAPRRRRPAFILLTVIGTLLVFAAVPFRFSGNNIALFWMIAAEALLIAGIVQVEVLFRRLGLLAGIVTGLLVIYEASGIIEFRQTSQSPRIQDGILLFVCSALFYLNAHFISRRWKHLFKALDGSLITLQSYIGGVTAFLGVWCAFTGDWTALGWAALLFGAALGKRYLDNKHLMAQAGLLVAVVWLQAVTVNLHYSVQFPQHAAGRLITLPILALIFYLVAWALSGVDDVRGVLRTAALWAGSSLLVLLVYFDVAQPWVALVWIGFAVALSLIGRRIKLGDLTYQEHVLAIAVAVQLTAVNLDAQNALERYLPLAGCAVAFYAVSRLCTLKDAPYKRPAAWAHTWLATALLAALAWHESPQPWLTVIFALFALALAVIDRVFVVEELPYQAHVLAMLAVAQAVTLNLFTQETWRGVDLRLITVSMLVAVLYALARWVRMPAALDDLQARHVYTWAASGLAAWMLWAELQPVGVAVGLAVFGLLLFEFGEYFQQRQIRLQGYAALAASFGRIFFVNLTAASLPGEALSPRIYTVAPLALIYLYVWRRLQSCRKVEAMGRWKASDILAYFGTVSIASLLYYQTAAEWIVVAWAILAVVLVIAALLLDKEVFLEQAVLLVVGLVGRGLAHNIFGGSYFAAGGWRGNFLVLSLTAALLLSALPVAFHLRQRYASCSGRSLRAFALRYPEQFLFFAPVVLVSFMIAVKMNPGMVTLSWGIEGVMVILLGLIANQRSYRITGLLLLLLCVGKIVCLDAWRLVDRDRYITFIVLGAALLLVSMLYGRYRDVVRRLL